MLNKEVFLHQMELGPMQNFIYFLGDSANRKVAIIDPGWEAKILRAEIETRGLDVVMVLLTHGHYDHVGALEEILKYFDVPVYLSDKEMECYRPKIADIQPLTDGQTVQIGDVAVTVIHTPGHSPGGVCFYVPDILIAGDTLFIDACGRVDLPGGDGPTLLKSLKTKLKSLPDETIVYPGHNYHEKPCDTLGNQKKTNPYLRNA